MPRVALVTIRFLAVIAAAVFIAAAADPAAAITNGTSDGDAHPDVGIAISGDTFCSGTLLSPTVFLTAGHCTAAFASTGQPTFVTFDPSASPSSVYVTGVAYTDPSFYNVGPQGLGVPDSVGGDLGVVVLNQPVQLPAYGTLPAQQQPASSAKALLTIVGYGAQGWTPAPRGRIPVFTFARTQAPARLINNINQNSDEFVLVSANPGNGQGGIGPGDSGGPAFLNDTTTIAAIGSHVTSCGCGNAYFSRLDTPDAQEFIKPFLSSP